MTRNLIHLMLVLAVLSPAAAFGAEAIKLKYVASLYTDGAGEGLKLPQGTACYNNSILIVADTGNGRLLKYDFRAGDPKFEAEFKLSQIQNPTRLQVNSRGEILTLNEKKQQIVRISPAGEFMGVVAPQGLPAPEAYVPRSFKIDSHDNVYVLDILSERVLVLNADGKYLRGIKFPPDYGFISDVAVDSSGTVLLLDTKNCMLFSAAQNAETFSALTERLKEYMLFPTSMTIDKEGVIYIVDEHGGSLAILGKNGQVQGRQLTMGWKEGLLRYPSQACISEQGTLFIADRENNRIQVFSVVK